MKIFVSCMQCLTELGRPSFEPLIVDYYDDGIARFTCSAGHDTAQMIQSSKFEILLESGATALLEGFTFEACASFSAALERFYEFALRVICASRCLSPDAYADMFAEMARQSERQLGAFMLLYALEFGKAYKPDAKIIEFRNSVIHKGTIPTHEEARQFAERVYTVISALCQRLRENHSDHMWNVTMREIGNKRAKLPPGAHVATNSGTIFFNATRAESPPDFATALESFRKARAMISGAIPEMQALHDRLKGGPA